MPLKLGKLPFHPDPSDLMFSEILPKGVILPRIPKPHGGFGMDFADWLMLGNGPDDTVFPGFGGAGDCFWAGQGHAVMANNHNARKPIPPISGATTIDQYSAYVASINDGQAYDPQTGANDTGSYPRSGLQWIAEKGFLDDRGTAHKILLPVLLDPHNPQEWWDALWVCEQIGYGMSFPQSAMDQFNADNEMWTYVPGSPDEGGHWIIIEGHPTASIWTGVTWARRQTMTQDFMVRKADEVWAWWDAERVSAVTGKDVEGLTPDDVQHYIAVLAARFAQT